MNKTIKVIAINLALIATVIAVFEIGLRFFVQFNPGYYTGVKKKGDCVVYPYGPVCLNSRGYPDSEFNMLSRKPRVGYFGDSVCYGVGAGQARRVTELVKKHYPAYEHFNFCYIGENILSHRTLKTVRRLIRDYELSYVVYLMNLNDIAPLQAELAKKQKSGNSTGGAPPKRTGHTVALTDLKKVLVPVDELLRGRSYLYTYLRSKIKERVILAGYEASGFRAIELEPGANRKLFELAARKLNDLAGQLKDRGIAFTVVILPYEMQTSLAAANRYAEMGVKWEAGFAEGSAQEMLVRNLDPGVTVIDARWAFKGTESTSRVGEFFVYNLGDKMDWNHPNVQGHRRIADYLINQHVLPEADRHAIVEERRP